jgi:hypothetical protein
MDINPPAVSTDQVIPDSIANKICPAVIFAASRAPKDIAFAACDASSITTINGAKTSGVPEGINIEK